mgnify:CR=1 FL=1
MLRVYQPITSHPIYTLHSQLEHLVCEVWCNANATPCENLLQPSFRIIYNAYSWLKTDIDTIYAKCVPLTVPERELITTAFNVNNSSSPGPVPIIYTLLILCFSYSNNFLCISIVN